MLPKSQIYTLHTPTRHLFIKQYIVKILTSYKEESAIKLFGEKVGAEKIRKTNLKRNAPSPRTQPHCRS